MTNIVLAALSTGIEGGFSVIYDIPQDLWDSVSQIFDKSNVNKLLWNISGDSTATVDNMAPIEALAATRVTSADMIANYNKVNPASVDEDLYAYANYASADAAYYASANTASVSANPATSSEYLIPANSAFVSEDYSVSAKSYDAEIIVELGGLKWTPVYLSTTNEGKDSEPHDVILTLWLADNQQDAWADRKNDEGLYYGFLDGALYSDWSANWFKDNPTETYPSDMYGTSYIKAVTLNNGGSYATSGTKMLSAEQSDSNPFALFTMEKFGLTNFIVTPGQVSWQESGQSAKEQIDDLDYDLPNENWGNNEKVPNTDFYNDGQFNYAGKESNDAWKNDFLWLPSLSETGSNDTSNGIWKTSTAQRFLSKTSVSGTVGSVTGPVYPYTWLRSGCKDNAYNAFCLYTGVEGWHQYRVSSNSFAVRPALHLNLTAVAKSLKN